jgi:cellulose synthase/poly-beta-1,6-N-acetylglucosamine synthase-like glycosyltransferase
MVAGYVNSTIAESQPPPELFSLWDDKAAPRIGAIIWNAIQRRSQAREKQDFKLKFALHFPTKLRLKTMNLSVVMPVYNERATLRQVVQQVLAVPLEIELICVDDGSSDGSREILAQLQVQHPQIRVLFQARNMGKGRRPASRYSGSYGGFRRHPGCRS